MMAYNDDYYDTGGSIQKFPDWPLEARTGNATGLYH
jgi:hypothetical protein